ncbi:MAG TPA: AMP-binding protein [Thermomicrobiaceae bacterium]|nr:AMP-binding protein [Thermomicrobiaceae bacterium]
MDTLVDILERAAGRWAHLPAVRYHGAAPWGWSYGELWDASRRAAAHLADAGVARSDRVVLWGANRPEWVAAFFGVQILGAVAVPLDMRSDVGFVERIVARAEPRHLLVGREQARRLTDPVTPLTILDDLRDVLAARDPLRADAARVEPTEVAELVYTSGTTGNPKGVMLTHRNVVSNTMMARTAIEPTTRHRALSILPLSHMFEQTSGLFAPLAGGASITYVGSLRPDVIFEAMGRYQITHMSCVPQVLQLFREGVLREVRKQGRERQFGWLLAAGARLPIPARRLLFRQVLARMGGAFEFFVSGGAYLDPDLGRWWETLGVKVVQGYGMTEASPIVATNSLTDRDVATVGRVLPGIEVAFDEDGEIRVRGDNISPGYWNDPVATAAAFSDGWYRTGDLGYLDAAGRLRLRGRKKDVIVLANGMNVYPEDVEHVLAAEPGVKGAVVLGVGSGQDVQVHAVLLLDRDTSAATIVRRANAGLAPHQQIRGHTVWPDESFPLTPTLKVRRAEIAARLPELGAPPIPDRAGVPAPPEPVVASPAVPADRRSP